jgi:pimeloyl-ACP methyl ester carboxylesterase
MKKAAKQPPPLNSDSPIRAPSPFLLALEGRAFIEWAACVAAWPLLACAARGDGHPVMVLPGLAVGDTTTLPLRKFIEGRGYASYGWDLGLNYGPRDGIMRKLVARLHQIERKHKRKVSLVGWSLGGAMARALAVHEPKRVRSVISLGSPLSGEGKSTNAWRIFEFVSGVRSDDPRLRKLMSRNPTVPSTSILSKTDGIVAWPASLIPQTRFSENIEVGASHFGMGANPAVLWAIADRLAQDEGEWKPFDRRGLRAFLYDDPRPDAMYAT